jgi:hypothetical protein
MNYPRLIAQEGSSIGYGNISWQVVTGIGFLFGSAPQAFFMNQIGGWMLVLIAILSLQIFLTGHRKVTWSILGSAFLLSLPMLVFQQAKDMKVDPALFALSIVAFTLTFLFHQHKEGVSNERHTLLACIGICIGIAFAIKITSLMLLLGII